MEIRNLAALEIAKLIKDRQISCPEVVRVFINASKKDYDKTAADKTKLNAFTELYEESAMVAADEVQKRIDAGEELSPLAGVPVALKDNICSTEGTTTASSKMLGGFRSPFDAGVVERLRAAGAIIIGKTNMDEFAMGFTTENSYYGPTRNPWNTDCVPGGSSGGSAAAVAAGLVPYALGSDTGGSVRQPSGWCGLTGLKPTYGNVSRHGLIAFASSLDQIGPMARNASDLAAIYSIISGSDKRDSTSFVPEPLQTSGIIRGNTNGRPSGETAKQHGAVKAVKIGLPKNHYDIPGLSQEVKTCVLKAAETLEKHGAEIVEIEIPYLEQVMPTYLTLSRAEASSNLARFDGIKYGYRTPNAAKIEDIYKKSRGEGFGDEVKRRLIFGAFVLTGENMDKYYRKAQKLRILISQAYDKALNSCELILTPVTRTTAWELGGGPKSSPDMFLGDIYTASANLCGLPGAAAPCGFSEGGLPIGMQLVGKTHSEDLILETIARFQQATDHHVNFPGGAF